MRAIDFQALAAPFPQEDLEFRVQQAGEKNGRIWALVVPYVTNRAIMSRFDEVCGPDRWWNEYRPGPAGGVLCGISVLMEDGRVITKWDGAENTEIEPVKGGISASMKRAAVVWGPGRILYSLPEMFAVISEDGRERGKTREGKSFRWNAPALPNWALPQRLTPTEREHTAMLDYLRENGPRAPEDLQAKIRKEWKNATAKYADAAALCGLVEEAGGPNFQPPA